MSKKYHKMCAKLKKLLLYTSVVIIIVSICGPTMWMVATSLKGSTEVYDISSLLPKNPIAGLRNYVEVFNVRPLFLRWILNSLLVSGTTAFLAIAIGSLGAYSFSRFRFLGRQTFWMLILLSYLLPQTVLLIPLFLLWKWARLLTTYHCLILTYLTFTIPLSTWLLTSFFNEIPPELDDAAKIDGCSTIGVFLKIIIPLSKHGLAATAIFAFIRCWSEFLFAMTFMLKDHMWVLSVGILTFIGDQFNVEWRTLMASTVIGSIPALILALFVQKTFKKGIMFGALK